MILSEQDVKAILARFNLGSLAELQEYCVLDLMLQKQMEISEVLALSLDDLPAIQEDGAISKKLKLLLGKWVQKRPTDSGKLFCALNMDQELSEYSMAEALEQAALRAGVTKKVDLYTWYLYGLNALDANKSSGQAIKVDSKSHQKEKQQDRMESLYRRWKEIVDHRRGSGNSKENSSKQ